MYERKYTTTLTNVWCVQNDGECNECGQRGVCDGRGHGGALDDCNRLCFREIRPRATAILRAVSRDERVRAQRPAVCYCEPRVAYIYIYITCCYVHSRFARLPGKRAIEARIRKPN